MKNLTQNLTQKMCDVFLTEGATLDGDVIRSVVVCGPVSKNGRKYSSNALRKAAPLYEGQAVYVNHDPKAKGRKAEDRFGILENSRYVEQENKVRADLRFLKSHPMAERITETQERGLPWFGLSHVADGRGWKEDGKTVVEEVTRVMSVDLVDNAATASLVEQAEGPADPFVAAAMALLEDTSMSKEDLLAKLGELWDTLRDGKEKPEETPEESPMPTATEQALREQLKQLTEQVAQLSKPKKYLRPKMSSVHVNEQTTSNGIPTERAALAAWLKSNK